MLTQLYGFGNLAGALYALPNILSGIVSPFLGYAIDKHGKRPLCRKYQNDF